MSKSLPSEETDSSSDSDFNEKKEFFADASNHEFFVHQDKEIQESERSTKKSVKFQENGTNMDSYQKHLAKQLREMLDK